MVEARYATLAQTSTTLISDALDRLDGIKGLTRFDNGGRMVGLALTVKTRPGDNLALYKALTLAKPGDVLVVDGGGAGENALVGELLRDYAIQRQTKGFVIDGAIRDVTEFRNGNASFACFARCVAHRGPYKDGPGRINVPVAVGGHVVSPGDVVVGDDDGLVSFPQQRLDEVLELCQQRLSAESKIRNEIQTGAVEQSWIDAMMKAAGGRVT